MEVKYEGLTTLFIAPSGQSEIPRLRSRRGFQETLRPVVFDIASSNVGHPCGEKRGFFAAHMAHALWRLVSWAGTVLRLAAWTAYCKEIQLPQNCGHVGHHPL